MRLIIQPITPRAIARAVFNRPDRDSIIYIT